MTKRKVQLKDFHSKNIKTDKSNPFGIPDVKDSNSREGLHKSLNGKDSPERKLNGHNANNKCTSSSGKTNKEREHSTRLPHSSYKLIDKNSQEVRKGHKKADSDQGLNQCEILTTLSESIKNQTVSNNAVKKITNDDKRIAHVPVDDRKELDSSDMCHHVHCSRTGPFDLLASLGQTYRGELENLKISPRSQNVVKADKIPVVQLNPSNLFSWSSQKSTSVESADSESDNEKGKRHFTDVFSDISEAESDCSIKHLIGEDLDNMGSDKNMYFGAEEGDIDEFNKTLIPTNTTLEDVEDATVIEKDITDNKLKAFPSLVNENMRCFPLIETFKAGKNFCVKVDEFSDISDDDVQKDKKLVTEDHSVSSIDISDDRLNMTLGGNDILGNSTLTISDTDSDVMVVDEVNDNKTSVENSMPVLEKALHGKSKSLIQSFEMPILEKYTEMYSSFKGGLCEQEVLPDIEDDSIDASNSEVKDPELARTNIRAPSRHSSESNQSSGDAFKNFTLSNDSSNVTVSKTVSSFMPNSSHLSASSSGIKHSNSSYTLSSPKDCSTPKARKHKMHKSKTFSSLQTCESYSSYTPNTSSSHYEELALSKQMDQLTVYMKDFLQLSDAKLLPGKLPDAQKNIVYGCEEEGLLNLGHALNFIEHFGRKYIIPSDVCKDVIKSAFLSECSLTHIHWAYNLLSELNTKRTAEIEISWETMEDCLNKALTASQGKPYYQLLQSTLLLELAGDVLKMDLFSRNLSDNREIRKSFAYKMFAYDVSTGSRKRLIYFLNQALHAGQCRTLGEGEKFRLPDVLPILQVNMT